MTLKPKLRADYDIGAMLPILARSAAEKVRLRKAPLSRSEALASAPWDAKTMPPAWERAFREAYADRLEERGVSAPAKAGGASGKGGSTELVQARLYLSAAELDQQKATAKAAGLSWSTWARRKLCADAEIRSPK